jgi:preprotein translocase subunit SecY
MIGAFRNVAKIPELRKRILFTLLILAVYRLGTHIPTPGVDPRALAELAKQASGGLLGFYDLFAGGALMRATIFALGIMPYISASIIFQLLVAVVPALEKLQKEGEEGRRKITQYTRYATVGLGLVQGFGISVWLEGMGGEGASIVIGGGGWSFRVLTMISFTAGTIVIMWLGEQISERGIGNGISLIIFVSIVSRAPSALVDMWRLFRAGNLSLFTVLLLAALVFAIVAAIVVLTQATRRIPIQYPRQVKGRRVYGGQKSYLPLRVNTAGVIPIIFATSILMLPMLLLKVVSSGTVETWLSNNMAPQSFLYNVLYAAFIIFFCFFYTAIMFNPIDVADNMKKYGGFIPGIRPGKPTAGYLDFVMTRVTVVGAISLALVALLPVLITSALDIQSIGISGGLGGTSMLIVVGVGLDTTKQIETHLLMRHYDGFMKKGRVKARR